MLNRIPAGSVVEIGGPEAGPAVVDGGFDVGHAGVLIHATPFSMNIGNGDEQAGRDDAGIVFLRNMTRLH